MDYLDDDNTGGDMADTIFLADATPFLRIMAQILRRLLTQLDNKSSPLNNGNRQETVIKGE